MPGAPFAHLMSCLFLVLAKLVSCGVRLLASLHNLAREKKTSHVYVARTRQGTRTTSTIDSSVWDVS